LLSVYRCSLHFFSLFGPFLLALSPPSSLILKVLPVRSRTEASFSKSKSGFIVIRAGPLYFTVSDAATANVNDFRQIIATNPRSPGQLISTANNLHVNNKAYVRVWRGDAAFQLEGADLPAPPASVALVLEGAQANVAGITQVRNSKIASMEIDGGDMVISGVKTIQVEVKP